MINIPTVLLIQELRAIHALSEIDIKININQSDEHKFQLLKKHFGMAYSVGFRDGKEISDLIETEHSIPSTSVLSIKKPLIYPKIITKYLRKKWPKKRKYKFCFAGLITSEREKVIEKWLLSTSKRSYRIKDVTFMFKVKRKLFFKLGIDRPLLKKFSELYIFSTNKGRVFPGKSWDEEYYKFMLKSKFTLCPSGVYIWTYRFFESILCGAIPIVEKYAPCYEGFIYYNMDEKLCNIKWSKEIVDHNYKLCIERITFTKRDIQNISKKINSKLKLIK